jgi:putative transposase
MTSPRGGPSITTSTAGSATAPGTWDRIIDILRVRLRAAAGRATSPRVACIDSQSVKTAGGGQEVGTDGGK